MADRSEYLRLDDVSGKPRGLVRARYSENGLSLERFNPTTGRWDEDADYVARFVVGGEVCAPVTAQEAQEVMRRLRPR
jgi:hypothetical protein